MGRVRHYQGELTLYTANKPASWILKSGYKAYINKNGYAGGPVRLTIFDGTDDRSPKLADVLITNNEYKWEDTNRSSAIMARVSIDVDGRTDCYCHMEDNMIPGGCILATLVQKKLKNLETIDDSEELRILRRWRDESLSKSHYSEILVSQYYDIAELLSTHLENLDDADYFQHLYSQYLEPLVAAASSKKHYEAFHTWREMLTDIERHLKIFSSLER